MILSVDIGLRNLSFCCMSAENPTDISTYTIHLWDVYNTLDSDDYKCEGIQKSGKVCSKKCGYKYKNEEGEIIYSCKSHSSKTLKVSVFKKKMIDDYLLQDIAKIVLAKIQEIYDTNIEIFNNITKIIIELQPKVNAKMSFTSHILYGKFVELYSNTSTTIRFVRASQKLKAYTGPYIECKLKSGYAKRNWLAVQYTIWFLENKFSQEQKDKWLPFLESKTIKADLSDTALMAINGHYGIPKKQFLNKKGKCIK